MVFFGLLGSDGGPWGHGKGLGLLGREYDPKLWWMDCLANFGPLQPDFKLHPFGGRIGAPGVTAGGTRPPGTWMRPKDADDGWSGKFWDPMT